MTIGINLAKALAAARAAAADSPLVASELANPNEPPEFWWYYPPSPAVQEAATRLQHDHNLLLILTATRQPTPRQVTTRWLLVEATSGESMELEWTSELFQDAKNVTLAVLGTARHHERGVSLSIFRIPVIRNGARVERARPRPAPPPEDSELPALASIEPIDAPVSVDEAIADPGPLPGDEFDAEELAADADAAARGEVVEAPDAARLWTASQAWRAARRASEADLRAAAGVPAGPLDDEGRARLWAFLTREAA